MEAIEDPGCHGDNINTLPEEILERILSFCSPYGEFKLASLVCKRWHRVIQGVIQQKALTFQTAAAEGRLQWSLQECPVTPLTARHSHNMCRVGEHIYVFGGCSSSLTSFNDMWKLHLGTRMWSRVLALGTYPSPKAAASMVSYNNCLILFGGWAPPVPYPLHQAPHMFNELQVFKIKENRWNPVMTRASPPPLAGHQATVVGDKMVVFGGMINALLRINDVSELDLTRMSWRQVSIRATSSNPVPSPRYGHLQYLVDKQHLLIIGGCGISNKTLSDIWLLKMGEDQWRWKEVEVKNQEHAPPVSFGHPACKIGDSITIFGKSKNPNKPVAMRRSQVIASAPRPAPPDRQSHIQRAPINVRQELRSHGVLLNGANKRSPSNGESKNGATHMDGTSDCQPSTSGQSSRGQSLNAADSQVCDEIHTNTSSATNTLGASGTLGAVAMVTNNSDGAISNIQSCSGATLSRQSVHGLCNNSEDSKQFQKSNLNEAHMGQFLARKNVGVKKARNSKSPPNAKKCMCNKNQVRLAMAKQPMQQYVLDISCVVADGYVTWQPIKRQETDHMSTFGPIRAGPSSQHGPPPETCYSSICEGRAELIMFGGLLEDSSQFGSPGKSAINSVHYAT